jgi:hypothetical protein
MKNGLIIIIVLLLTFCIAYADEIIVDNTPPVVAIKTPTTSSPAYNKSGESVRIVFNYSETNPSNYSVIIYNTTFTVCNKTVGNLTGGNATITENCTLPAVGDGGFNLTVNITDVVGNSSTDTQVDSVIVDTTAPQIVYSEPVNNSEIITSSVTMLVNTSEIAECRYAQFSGMNFSNMTIFSNTNSIQHSVVLSTEESGQYDFYIKCKDVANNTMPTDYHISFKVTVNFTVTGRTVYLNLVFHIGSSKGDDVYRYGKSYFASYDSSGVVLGIASSGSAIGIMMNKTYNSSDAMVNVYQSLENNRFIIAFTKGDSGTILGKLYQLGSRKIPSKTFGLFTTAAPASFPISLELDYDDIDITSRTSWSGSGSLIIKNNGRTSLGLPNITIEVVK